MPQAVLLVLPGLAHQQPLLASFAEGLRRHGWQAEITTRWRPSDLLVVWGVRRKGDIAAQRQHGGQVCVLERGYVGDRFYWTSVSFGGGLNGRGRFFGPFEDGARWGRLFGDLMQPWRTNDDGPVLICGQVPGDASLSNVDAPAFYKRASQVFADQGFDVRFRHHPKAPYAPTPVRTLAEDLAAARFAVTWNSNSGVDAVLAGVPTVVADAGGMAWSVAGHDLKPPPRPDRTAWAHRLAWCQWAPDELTSGACWDVVGRGLEVAA